MYIYKQYCFWFNKLPLLILIKFKILKKKKPPVVNFLIAIVKFPAFSPISLFLSNYLIFPHRVFFIIFPVFQSPWQPCHL